MKCMVCGKPLEEYAVIGKKKEMKVAFCTDHIPDCSKCDSCDLLCMVCGRKVEVRGKWKVITLPEKTGIYAGGGYSEKNNISR